MGHTKLHGLGDTAEHSSATIAQLNALISDATLSATVFKSASLTTTASGTYYTHGYYDAATTDANLTQASATQTHGTANQPYAAHAFIVAGAAGSASGGTGAVEIEVSGTSINDSGTRTGSDTEIIVADITAMSTNAYYETTKKWLGQVTFTLQNAAGSTQTTFSADFNYGFCKYEDYGNVDFTVTDFEVVGVAGASDTSFNIELLHHHDTGWTYAATGFTPGGTVIANMNTDHGTEEDLTNGDSFAYKRANLSTSVTGTFNVSNRHRTGGSHCQIFDRCEQCGKHQ
jgi:hypothetical protein